MKFQQNSKGQPESLQQSSMERLTREDFHSRMCQAWRWSLRKTSGCTKYPTLPFNNIPGIKQRRNTDLAYSQIPIQLTRRLADSLGPSPSNFYHHCTQQNLTLAGWRVAQVNNISIHTGEREPNKNLLSRVHKALPVTHPGLMTCTFTWQITPSQQPNSTTRCLQAGTKATRLMPLCG